MSTTQTPEVVSPAEWLAARKKLLAREKQYTQLRDALAAERQVLPWVRVDQQLCFRHAVRAQIPRGAF